MSAGAATIAMRAAGYYSLHTLGAGTVINRIGDLVLAAAAKTPPLGPGQRSPSRTSAPPTAARRWT